MSSALDMAVANKYQTRRCYIPEADNPNTNCCDSLTSHAVRFTHNIQFTMCHTKVTHRYM